MWNWNLVSALLWFCYVLLLMSRSYSVSHWELRLGVDNLWQVRGDPNISVSWRQQTCQHLSVSQSNHRPDMKLQTQENLRLQNEIRKLEAILPAVDSSQKENVDVVSLEPSKLWGNIFHAKFTFVLGWDFKPYHLLHWPPSQPAGGQGEDPWRNLLEVQTRK